METNVHLWWNGYDHAAGATQEEALRWMMQQTGESAENCEGDGWVQVPDDEPMRDEAGGISEPRETAGEMARAMLTEHPLRGSP